MTPDSAARLLTDAGTYADPALFARAASVLRAEAPVCRVEPDDYRPLWIVSRHADVAAVEAMPQGFTSAPRSVLTHRRIEQALLQHDAAERPTLRTLVHLDGAEHAALRGAIRHHFAPAALDCLAPVVEAVVTEAATEAAAAEGVFDAVERVSSRIPLRVLLHHLGLPPALEGPLMRLTQGLYSPEDPVRRLNADPGLAFIEALAGFDALLTPILESGDLREADTALGALCRASIDGRPLSCWDLFSNLVLLLTAGHDTTAYALSFALKTVAEDPALLEWLGADPARCSLAAQEVVRLASPVRSFMRNARQDVRIGDRMLPEGACVLLLYPSANLDEAVFADASTFRPDRSPNPHLGFGSGLHHCLGRRLALMQIETMLRTLARLPVRFTPAGPAVFSTTVFVGGIRMLPLAAEVRPQTTRHRRETAATPGRHADRSPAAAV